jgi:S-adenosylmethionine:tRNA ribosyltransferase-isomerase
MADEHRLESYDYILPKELIAQRPISPRDASRLLVVSRSSQRCADHGFRDLPRFLKAGDVLVLNNTKVIPARLQSNRGEVLLVRPTENGCWDALVFPGKHFKPGAQIEFDHGIRGEVLSQSSIGRILRLNGNVDQLLRTSGSMPLPPYIKRKADESDDTSYQTIFARVKGSIAAPTAGLHFTTRILSALRKKGVAVERITLHVGPGTFRPVKSEDIRRHSLYPEYYRCSRSAWQRISEARRVIAVGTTSTRAIETMAQTGQLEGYADLFIYPGSAFHRVNGLLTNFHLPKSSLLILVCALGGYDLVRRAYEHAIKEHYRFYSYGDAMLIV